MLEALISWTMLVILNWLGFIKGWRWVPIGFTMVYLVGRIAFDVDPYGAEAMWSEAAILLILAFMAFVPTRVFRREAEHQTA